MSNETFYANGQLTALLEYLDLYFYANYAFKMYQNSGKVYFLPYHYSQNYLASLVGLLGMCISYRSMEF